VFPHFSKLWEQVQQGEQQRMEVRRACGSVDQQAPRGETMSDKAVIIMLISSHAFIGRFKKKKESKKYSLKRTFFHYWLSPFFDSAVINHHLWSRAVEFMV
jgi:hypothetical protein